MLGELEILVLLAVLQCGEEAYGSAILAAIEERTGRSVARGSVYVTLDRLEQKGLVSSRLGEPTPVRGGRAKRFFKVEARGLRLLKRALSALGRMQDGLDPVLGRT